MNMESPVRICLGAVLVVNLILLSSTQVSGNILPQDTTQATLKDEPIPKSSKTNTSWATRNKPKIPDVSLNELSPKETISEENTDKNAKYKDRGRVRFLSQAKSSTESSLRRVRSSSEAAKLMIVTPTPEVKKPAEIIDSMRNYKKTKMPVISSTTPETVKKEVQNVEEYEDQDEEEDQESFEKFTSSKFHDNNFFTIPSFEDGDDSENESSNNNVKRDFSNPSYSFSSFFPKDTSYGYKEDTDPFKSSFSNFDTELTTPKNDFFDSRYRKISKGIRKNLDSIKAKASPPNITNVHTVVKENIDLGGPGNNTSSSNKSSVFIKNTKEIRTSDNEGADSVNKELPDVKGTSIYYEMSVLSTETYAIHSDDDDCDNDTLSFEPTASTSMEEELASLKETQPTFEVPTKSAVLPTMADVPTKPETDARTISSSSSDFFPISSAIPLFNTLNPIPVSTQNSISSTERVTKLFSSNFNRNRNSKWLSGTGIKDSPNSVTAKTDVVSIQSFRPQTRKFHYTTPRNKPIWMAPRRNVTKITYPRQNSNPNPSTIYSEHFNVKDKYSTTRPRQPNRTILTTVSSEIDPVLQSDVSGTKKVVHSQTISDNSIPSVWKRGSTRFRTSTATSAEVESGTSEMEIPPTMTAWALASLRSPPSQSSTTNTTVSTQKSVDENELQKVGEIIDKNRPTMDSIATSTTTASPISNDIIPKVTDVDQNRLPLQPVYAPTSPASEVNNETATSKSERLPAESNISVQSSAKPTSTEAMKAVTKSNTKYKTKVIKPLWVPAAIESEKTTEKINEIIKETIPPVDATRSTGFESITKLPSDITTPQDETVAGTELNQTVAEEKPRTTTDFEITTIRFSYVPTEETEETTQTIAIETTTENGWYPIMPTRTKITTIKDRPITTYRPIYMTTTEVVEETTTTVPETTPVIEVSSLIAEKVTESERATTESIENITTTTEEPTTHSSTTEATTEPPTTPTTTKITTTPTTTTEITTTTPTTTEMTTQPTTTPVTTKITTTTPVTTTIEDTTTIIVEVVTEINTEKERMVTTSLTPTTTETETPPSDLTDEDCTSDENNEVITQDTKLTTTVEPTFVTTEGTTQEAEVMEITTQHNAKIFDTNVIEETTTDSGDLGTKAVNNLEDLSSYTGELTTEAYPREEAGSGAAVAIAVSTIGVIALILLIGLLVVARRRGRRGIYAQRCTPVSLDAYSLDSVSVGHRKGNQRLRASKRSYGNPAYDDEVTSHPMQYPALASFAMDIESIMAEFAEIPSVIVRPEEVPPGCEDKNRYSNVLPLPETRVPLKRIGNDPTTEYINANFVTGPGNIRNYYIMCQAPLSNTVVDFWRMIWEQNSRLIVMLTEYMENGVEKCYEYLPPSEVSDNKRIFGEYQIILKKREQRDKYAISSVQLINLTTRTWREVTHLWYFWPAKGVPDDYDSILDFLSEMRSYMKMSQTAKEYDEEGVEVIYGDQSRSSFNNLSKLRSEDSGSGNGLNVYSPSKAEEQMRRANNGTLARMKAASEAEGIRPCVVTCASGAGRAAALVALEASARALAAGAADVPRAVRTLRAQRPHSLANRHHYIFIYKVLSEYGNKLMGGGVDTI